MPGRKLALAGAVALALSGSLVVQTADPVRAADFPGYVTDYLLALPGEQLYANNTPAAKAAWQGNMDAFASRSAAAYSASAMFGNVTPDRVAGVIPINSVRNPDLPGTKWDRFKSGMKSLSVPFTGAQPGYKPKVGAGGAVVAATAYAFRAEITDGTLGLFGMDANSAVCGNDVARDGFVNFLTGQDCTGWGSASSGFVPNEDASGDPIWGSICVPSGSYCLNVMSSGEYHWKPASVWHSFENICFSETGTRPAGLRLWWNANARPSGVPAAVSYQPAGVGSSTYGTDVFVDQSVRAPDCAVPAFMGALQFDHAAGGPLATGTEWPSQGISGLALTTSPVAPSTGWVSEVPGSTDPDRVIVCTVRWSGGSVTNGSTQPFRESSDAFPDPVCPQAPAGQTPKRVTLTVTWPGGSYVYFDQESTPEYEQFMTESAQCLENACFLDVVQTETGLSCFSQTITESCRDWFTDPSRDTKYKCQYGGKDKPMQSCYVYANVFNADKRAQGLAYVDPSTGEEIPGAVTSTRADEYVMGQGVRPGGAAAPRSCWGGTATWSPVDWVLRPIQCAAEWAFVPRPSVVAKAQADIKSSFDETPAGMVIAAVSGWAFAPMMTGCKIEFQHWTTGQTLSIVDACPGSFMAPVADISRKVSVVGAIVMSVSVIRRQIAGTVDYKGN